ncbi:hypothetical protein AAHH78_42015, partial [Burkholderia pseudomallei]
PPDPALRRRPAAGAPLDHLDGTAPPAPPPDARAGLRGDANVAAQEHGVLHLFRIVKLMLAAGYGGKPIDWTIVTRET